MSDKKVSCPKLKSGVKAGSAQSLLDSMSESHKKATLHEATISKRDESVCVECQADEDERGDACPVLEVPDKVKPKRVLSPEARGRLLENLQKAREAKRLKAELRKGELI